MQGLRRKVGEVKKIDVERTTQFAQRSPAGIFRAKILFVFFVFRKCSIFKIQKFLNYITTTKESAFFIFIGRYMLLKNNNFLKKQIKNINERKGREKRGRREERSLNICFAHCVRREMGGLHCTLRYLSTYFNVGRGKNVDMSISSRMVLFLWYAAWFCL